MYTISDFSTAANIGLISFNPKTKKFTQVNKEFCELLGYSEEQLLKQIYTNFLFHEDIESSEEYVKNRTLKFSKLANYINRYVHGKTGKIITVMWISDSAAYNQKANTNTSLVIDITDLINEYYKQLVKNEGLMDLFKILKDK